MEILPDIHYLPWGQPSFPGAYPPNVYLLAGEEATLIDTGYPEEAPLQARLDYIKDFPLGCIVATHNHPDHISSAPAIIGASGARLLVHSQAPATRSLMEAIPPAGPMRQHLPAYFQAQSLIDGKLEDGQRLKLGAFDVEVVHTPGHTPDHICLWLPEIKTLFTGDQVLGAASSVVWDMTLFMESLHKLLRFPAQLLCPGHGPLIEQPQMRIREVIARSEEREEEVLSCLRRGLKDVPSIVKELYPDLIERRLNAAERQVKAHLEKLTREGKVRQEAGQYSPG